MVGRRVEAFLMGSDKANGQIFEARRGLVALNAVLLLMLAAVTLTPLATAQGPMGQANPSRVPGDYMVVAGEILGSSSNTIYVLDTVNREMVALNWNDSTNSVEGVGFRDLVQDINADPDR